MFKVIEVLNYNTIKVSPSWQTEDRTGNIISIRDIQIPDYFLERYKLSPKEMEEFYLKRTKKLLSGSIVKLYNYVQNDKDQNNIEALYCDVHLNEVNIKNYYPEFKPERKSQFSLWKEKIKNLRLSIKRVSGGIGRHTGNFG